MITTNTNNTAKPSQLTATQARLLAEFKTLPARYRVNDRAGGTIKADILDSRDGRSWTGLFQKGLLAWNDHGFFVTDTTIRRASLFG